MSRPVDTGPHHSIRTSPSASVFGALEDYGATADAFQVERPGGSASGRAIDIESAVFAHIRAMRTLGHTTVNTRDVARALALPLSIVDRAVAGMSTKGVRVAK